MKYAFYTLGCKVNQYETSVMQQAVIRAGHTVVSPDADTDAVVINSCTVTAESDRKTRQTVRRFRRSHPDAVIVLTGCLPQAFPDDAAALDAADVLLGNGTNDRLISAVDRFLRTGERVTEIEKHTRGERFCTPVIDRFPERTRAYIKIQDGCERFCTYCIIPTARGYIRSKVPEAITEEAAALAANGHREIVLVGINLSTYGRDIGKDLCDAVDAACTAGGVERVRLGSLEPDLFTDEMLERLSAQPKLCPQFHLALQSGCDATLHRMCRQYDTAFYADLVSRIRERFEGCSVTTDVMVGFAGETDEEFARSVEFVKRIGFAKCHVFAYSRRAGTPADRMKGHLPRSVKEERSRIMIAAAKESEREFLSSQTGIVSQVLFEVCENGICRGYTANYTPVAVKCGLDLHGRSLSVRITGVQNDECTGELI